MTFAAKISRKAKEIQKKVSLKRCRTFTEMGTRGFFRTWPAQ